jgi:hypothetical protein
MIIKNLAHMPQADNNHNKKQNIPPHYLGKMPSSHYTVAVQGFC